MRRKSSIGQWKKKGAVILILAVLFSLLNNAAYSTSVQAESVINYGNFEDYNAVLLGNHSATTADVEGRIAVRGNSETSINNGYSYAASYSGYATVLMGNILDKADSASLDIPSVLVGGKVILNPARNTIIEGGDLVTWNNPGHSDLSKISMNKGEIKLVDQSEVLSNIDRLALEAQDIMDGFQKYYLLNNGETSVYYNDIYSNLDFYKSGLDNHVIVSKNTGITTFNVGGISLPGIASDETIVIYSDAATVNFASGAMIYSGSLVNTGAPQDATMKYLSPRIVWVFPDATKITATAYGIIGSVFAPKAEVTTQGGSINGQLYADSLHQIGGFELHNFIYNQAIPKAPVTASPSPSATATPSPSATATPSPSATATPSPSATATPSPSATATPSPTATATPSPTATATPSPTATATPSPTATATPSPTATPTPSPTVTAAPSPTATPSPSATATPSPSATATPSPTATATPSPTATATPTPSPTATATPSPTVTATPTPSPTVTAAPSPTAMPSPTVTVTPSPTVTAAPADPELTKITGNKLPKGKGSPEVPQKTTTNAGATGKKEIPKTGEESRMPVYITGSLLALLGIVNFKYRKHYSKMK